jgi:hypothetical protein
MGSLCGTESQPAISAEEKTLTEASNALGYQNHMVLHLDCQLKRVARKGRITPAQLERFASTVGLDFSNSGCFTKLIDETGYNLETLAVLGVLLGTGTLTQKAVLLFEQFDQEATMSISPDRVKHLLETIATLSVDCLPHLVELSPDLQAYCAEAARGLDDLVERTVASMCGGTAINQETFVQGMLRYQGWLNPTTVREALLKASKCHMRIMHDR